MSAVPASGSVAQAGSQSLVVHRLTMYADRIRDFANATDDHNMIHFDVEAARKVFGSTCPGPVAHGMLVLSILGSVVVERFGDGTMMREIGTVKPAEFVAVGDVVEYELEMIESRTRSGLMFIELKAGIYRIRQGNRASFTKQPIDVMITIPVSK